jgi:hypothetical protein
MWNLFCPLRSINASLWLRWRSNCLIPPSKPPSTDGYPAFLCLARIKKKQGNRGPNSTWAKNQPPDLLPSDETGCAEEQQDKKPIPTILDRETTRGKPIIFVVPRYRNVPFPPQTTQHTLPTLHGSSENSLGAACGPSSNSSCGCLCTRTDGHPTAAGGGCSGPWALTKLAGLLWYGAASLYRYAPTGCC